MRGHTMIGALIFMMVCLHIGGLSAYKNFFVPETEKVPVIEEKQAALQQIGTKIKEVVSKLKEVRVLKETAEAKHVVDEISGKEKDAKAQKTSAAEEKIKKLIAEVEQEIKENQKAAIAERQLMQEITGLIIEETMTKIGYEFYEYFFLVWKAPEVEVKHYNIVITERASPMWGSLVEVKIEDNTVWSRVLRPRSVEIEESAQQAIEATKKYLQDYQKYQLKTIDMMGTGI